MKTTECNCAAVDIGVGIMHEPGCPSQVRGGVEICEQCGNAHEPVCDPYAEQWTEIEAKMDACTFHKQLSYSDPEGDGCPECGWGSK